MPTIESYTGDNIQLTYIGTLPFPLIFRSLSRKVVYAPSAAGTGTPSTLVPANQVGVDSLSISDHGAANGVMPLTSLSFDNLGFISTAGCSADGGTLFSSLLNAPVNTLATLSFPALTDCFGPISVAQASGLSALVSLLFPNLVNVGGNVNLGNVHASMPLLSNLSFPQLGFVGGTLNVFPGSVTLPFSFSAPNLKVVLGSCQIGYSNGGSASYSGQLINLSLPALTSVGTFGCSLASGSTTFSAPVLNYIQSSASIDTLSAPAVTTISLPALVTVGNTLAIQGNGITTISLPAVVKLLGFTNSASTSALANVTLNTGLKKFSGSFTMTGAALTATSVNSILTVLATLDGTNGTTAYNSGTINLSGGTSAAPTGAGATAKSTLQGRGVTVTTN